MSQEQFRMVIEDTFFIKNRGTIVSGKIESGSVKKGDQVTLVSSGMEPLLTTTINGIPMPNPLPPVDSHIASLFFKSEEIHTIAKQGMFIISSGK